MLAQRLMRLAIASKTSFIPALCCNSVRVGGNPQTFRDGQLARLARTQPMHTSSQMCVQQRVEVKRKLREKKLKEAMKVKIISQQEGMDLTQLKKGWEKCTELQTADDTIKRIFSLEFASNAEKVEFLKTDRIYRVQKHPNDKKSLEVRIPSTLATYGGERSSVRSEVLMKMSDIGIETVAVARMTIDLRNLQEAQDKDKKNKFQKALMLIKQQKRDKLLRQLRKTNYESFELVCRELGITLDMQDSERNLRRVTKKGQLLQEHRAKIFAELRRRKKEEEEAALLDMKDQGEGDTAVTSTVSK